MRRSVLPPLCALVAAGGLLSARAFAQDAPKVAGVDVPAPKRTKTVMPQYPPEAQSAGIRGIVILELVIDAQGHVSSADVVRSIPALDDAALAAVRKWEYEVTKVDGRAISVRLTVPISFALKLPEVSRQDGVPEMQQGVAPAYPAALHDKAATVVAEVTLDSHGTIADALVTSGDAPWADALLGAIRTWKFAVDDPGAVVAFRVEARFVPGAKSEAGRVELRLTDPRRSRAPAPQEAATGAGATAPAETTAAQGAPTTPAATQPVAPSPTPVTPPSSPTAGAPAAPPSEPPPAVPPRPAPTPAPPGPAAPGASGVTPPSTTPPAPPTPSAPSAGAGPALPPPSPSASASGAGPAAAQATRLQQPPTEILSVPPPKAPEGPPENGVSAVRDISLSPGVPDLVKGRRPVVPPFARIEGATGTVRVRFSVSAAGIVSVQDTEGPDILKHAAEDAAASWSFRRASAVRLHLVAVFDYRADGASAAVSPEEPAAQ
jgi:TonB family protein